MAEEQLGTLQRCRIRAELHARGKFYGSYIVDISSRGMRLLTDEVAEVWTGDRVNVRSEELGLVTGTTRWRAPRRLGILLDVTTNNRAKLAALQARIDSQSQGKATGGLWGTQSKL